MPGRELSFGHLMLANAFVWVAIFAATAAILQGTPYFGQLLPILSGGAVWFVVILPNALRRSAGRD